MKIVFDIFEAVPEILEKMLPKDKELFETIIEFLEQRVAPLKFEISQEEAINLSCKLCVNFLPKENNQRIGYTGYSHELAEKIRSCFSSEDFIYLNRILNDKHGATNN